MFYMILDDDISMWLTNRKSLAYYVIDSASNHLHGCIKSWRWLLAMQMKRDIQGNRW